jgi:hypothetical protein
MSIGTLKLYLRGYTPGQQLVGSTGSVDSLQ